MTEIEALLEENDIVVTLEPNEDNPDMPNLVDGMSHWAVLIDGGKLPVHFKVSILRDGGDMSPPSVAEALDLLRFDLNHPHLGATDESWLQVHGIKGDRETAEDWIRARDAIADLRQAVCEHLPPEVAHVLAGAPMPEATPGMAA